MKSKDDLFLLIRSLSKSEKRYFKLRSSAQSGEKNYLKLFNALDKQSEYDEAKILKKFKGERFVKSLHVTKKYLHNLILRTLRDFHEKHDIEGELAGLLFNARILESKGLYAQCRKVLNVVHKKARKYDLKAVLIDVLQLKIKLSIMLTLKKRQAEVEGLYGELDEAVEGYAFEKKLRKHRDMIFMMTRQRGMLRKAEERVYMEEWAAFLLECGEPDDFWGRNYYFDGLGLYWRFVGARKKSKHNWQKALNVWNESDHFKESHQSQYLISFNNYLNGLSQVEEYDQMASSLKELEKLPMINFDNEAEQFWTLQNYWILYALNKPDFEKGKVVIAELSKNSSVYSDKVIKSRELIIYFNSSLLYFINGMYDKSLEWNYRVLADPKNELAEGIRRANLMLQLPIHYELGNYEVLESLVDSIPRNLTRNTELTMFETSILSFFKSLCETLPLEYEKLFNKFDVWLSGIEPNLLKRILVVWLKQRSNYFINS